MKKSRDLYLLAAATILGAFLAHGCSSIGRGGTTTNIAWTFERNLVRIDTTVGGREGSFLVGTASQHTIVDDGFPADVSLRGRVGVNLGDRFSAAVEPVRSDLAGLADGVLGNDVWRGRSLTIDYQRGLLIIGKTLDPVTDAPRFRFRSVPSVRVTIDGVETSALVDTASPDTVLLPARRFGTPGRRTISLRVGDTTFDEVDARVAPVDEVRLGNRILAHFLLTIDYPRREVSLWRHGRVPAPSAP
ncbi:MAG TPA: retropepsin-like aspartic protease [Thermoanaerobaculia bacterium]|nr:retropepsin-like aspartic protease [Thermoanaerobaculia bacterium]